MKKRLIKKLRKLGRLPWVEWLPSGGFIYHCVEGCSLCEFEREALRDIEEPITEPLRPGRAGIEASTGRESGGVSD